MEFIVNTNRRREIVDITARVEEAVEKSGVKEGLCLIHLPHATAGLILNEYEPNIESDYLTWFEQFFPKGDWAHNRIDDNAEAHLKSAMVGSGKCLPISNGRLQRGTWQSILLCEFDGPRSRRVIVKVVGSR